MELVAVAAVSENGVIGNDGELPWPSLPADKRQYRARVADAPVILGRRTFDSMRDDLPGERQLVLTRDANRSYPEPSATVATSVESAIDAVSNAPVAYVLGGGGAYEAFFPHFDRLVISRIPGRYHGEVTFPAIDPDTWDRVENASLEGFTLEIWERKD